MSEQQGITRIRLRLPFRSGSVNCYLVAAADGFVLIDTGMSRGRARLEKELENTSLRPGGLRLVLLTHGDFDHTGNAAYLAGKYGAKTAMHRDEAGMVERADIFWSRKPRNTLTKKLAALLFGFGARERFSPDLYVTEGDTLAGYGLDARVLHLPGHSRGSIGVLTAAGDFFCGDMLTNPGTPSLNKLIDDMEAARDSIKKLKALEVNMVYPGHGRPFRMAELMARFDESAKR